uniref:Uncharacterized protein n=1 Tax=Brassica oleracea var. oleracea TaxID=109376 RepID=A0A0D3AAW3_BRAOL
MLSMSSQGIGFSSPVTEWIHFSPCSNLILLQIISDLEYGFSPIRMRLSQPILTAMLGPCISKVVPKIVPNIFMGYCGQLQLHELLGGEITNLHSSPSSNTKKSRRALLTLLRPSLEEKVFT